MGVFVIVLVLILLLLMNPLMLGLLAFAAYRDMIQRGRPDKARVLAVATFFCWPVGVVLGIRWRRRYSVVDSSTWPPSFRRLRDHDGRWAEWSLHHPWRLAAMLAALFSIPLLAGGHSLLWVGVYFGIYFVIGGVLGSWGPLRRRKVRSITKRFPMAGPPG